MQTIRILIINLTNQTVSYQNRAFCVKQDLWKTRTYFPQPVDFYVDKARLFTINTRIILEFSYQQYDICNILSTYLVDNIAVTF